MHTDRMVLRVFFSVLSTFPPLQNPTGGLGGGNAQLSHLAPTYAAVLSLSSIPHPPSSSSPHPLSIVNRLPALKWLRSLVSPQTGAFSVCLGGETDVRGVYCALTIISLLRLPLAGSGLVTHKTTEWLRACQTYEGGFAASPNGNEAHGGYAFCALAALSILHPPARIAEIVDLPALIRWLTARQYAPEGGLSGRTNKLVDGCYSTWVGGCWALVDAALKAKAEKEGIELPGGKSPWNREGLIRYILAACQSPHGGLRDKPGVGPDFYHSAYILLGLASMQYYYYYDAPSSDEIPVNELGEPLAPLSYAFNWKYSRKIPDLDMNTGDEEGSLVEGYKEWPDVDAKGGRTEWKEQESGVGEGREELSLTGDRVRAMHPIFNVAFERIVEVEEWGKTLEGF